MLKYTMFNNVFDGIGKDDPYFLKPIIEKFGSDGALFIIPSQYIHAFNEFNKTLQIPLVLEKRQDSSESITAHLALPSDTVYAGTQDDVHLIRLLLEESLDDISYLNSFFIIELREIIK